MDISYRKLVAAESKQYREIRLESLQLHPESFGTTFEEQSKLPKLGFESALEQPTDERFMMAAFDGQLLVGICGFIPSVREEFQGSKNTGIIIQVYVKPGHHGRKIGLGLIHAALSAAFEIPRIEQVMLGVRKGNSSAIRVYEQAGFRIFDLEGEETEEHQESLFMIIHRDDWSQNRTEVRTEP